ncbi:MAG: porin family protein [Flavobacteriales bacterium]|nr:porin family protein [Flavobacteriales bacterium]
MRKSLLVSFLALMLSGTTVFAQYSEVGLLGGISFYMGDLNPDMPFRDVRPAGGLFYRYNFNDRFSVRAAAHVAYLVGSDASSTDPAQLERNLSFESWLFDFSVTGEFNFFKYAPGDMRHWITPFLFGGISIFKFNPRTELNGEMWELQPLGTEGQGTTFYPDRQKYSLVNAAIPFGLGVKVNISKTFSVGVEWGMRYTFTDYLDDVSTTYADIDVVQAERGDIANALSNRSVVRDPVSGEFVPLTDQQRQEFAGRQRGNSTNNDWYSFVLLSVSMNIKARPEKCPAYE